MACLNEGCFPEEPRRNPKLPGQPNLTGSMKSGSRRNRDHDDGLPARYPRAASMKSGSWRNRNPEVGRAGPHFAPLASMKNGSRRNRHLVSSMRKPSTSWGLNEEQFPEKPRLDVFSGDYTYPGEPQ